MPFTVLAIALVLAGPAPSSASAATEGLGPIRLGMTRDEVKRAVPCRWSVPRGQHRKQNLECTSFKIDGLTMDLEVVFENDLVVTIRLGEEGGYSEKRARQGIATLLALAAREFGELKSTEPTGQSLEPDRVFASLKKTLTYERAAILTAAPSRDSASADVTVYLRLWRDLSPRPAMIAPNHGDHGAAGTSSTVVSRRILLTVQSRSARGVERR